MKPIMNNMRTQTAESRPTVSEALPRLLLLTNAPNAGGQPCVVPSLPTPFISRRAARVISPPIAATLAALRIMEGKCDAGR